MGSTTPQDEHTITEQDVTALSTLDTPATKQKYVRFDHARAVTLRLREKLTYKQIAQRMNTTESHVVNSLKKFYAFLEEPGNLYAYRDNKSDLLETMEYRLLVYLSDLMNDKKCASVKDIALALKVVNELGRLERGQSTSNVSVLLKSIEEAHKDPLSRNITDGSGVEGNAITSSPVSGTPSQEVLRAPSGEVVSSPPYRHQEEVDACPEKSPLSGSSTPVDDHSASSNQTNSPEPTATLPSNDCTK